MSGRALRADACRNRDRLLEVAAADAEPFTSTRQRIGEALSLLVEAGVKAGTIRADTDPEDLLRALSGVCMATDAPGWQEQACRISGLLMDGLRYGAASEAKI